MESLADPQHQKLTVTERCELLGINRSTWYDRMENPVFRARASRCYRRLCDEHLAGVLESLTRSAKLDGREGHQDRRLFLELLGEYVPGQIVDEHARKPTEKMTDAELIQAFEGREHLLPPGVLRRLGRDPNAVHDKPIGVPK